MKLAGSGVLAIVTVAAGAGLAVADHSDPGLMGRDYLDRTVVFAGFAGIILSTKYLT